MEIVKCFSSYHVLFGLLAVIELLETTQHVTAAVFGKDFYVGPTFTEHYAYAKPEYYGYAGDLDTTNYHGGCVDTRFNRKHKFNFAGAALNDNGAPKMDTGDSDNRPYGTPLAALRWDDLYGTHRTLTDDSDNRPNGTPPAAFRWDALDSTHRTPTGDSDNRPNAAFLAALRWADLYGTHGDSDDRLPALRTPLNNFR